MSNKLKRKNSSIKYIFEADKLCIFKQHIKNKLVERAKVGHGSL
jgi:hypothetical protein